jgi:hypothetical protein
MGARETGRSIAGEVAAVRRIGSDRALISTQRTPALPAGLGLLTLALGWGLAALMGCSESSEQPCAPEVASAYIVGRIEMGVYPVDASVRASRVDLGDSQAEKYVVERSADDRGGFAMAVPAGEYVVSARTEHHDYFYTADGAVEGYPETPDTLSVATGDSLEVVFRLGSLIVEISATAPELNDRPVYLVYFQMTEDGDIAHLGSDRALIADGMARFTLPGLQAGGYTLGLCPNEIGSGDEMIWLPGTHDPDAAEAVEVTPGVVTTYAVQLPDRPAVVRGRVIGSWQRMELYSYDFSVLTADSVVILEGSASDPDGGFRGEIWIPEPVRIACTIEGSTRWVGGGDFASATEFGLASGEEIDVGTIEESGLLVELIEPTFPDDSEFDLQLVRADDGTLARTLQVPVGAWRSNLVPFLNLDPGVYYLRADNSHLSVDWLPQWFDRAATLGEATPITIPGGGSVVPIALTMEPGGSFSGRVLNDFEGAPSRFVIYVVEAATRETAGFVYCDCARGCYGNPHNFPFLARGIADGEYRVGAMPYDCSTPPSAAPAGTIWYPGTAEWETAGIVTIADHAAVTGIDIAWPPGEPGP